MGNIVLLDDLTINKIAAGEVIERPASVIKEMVENSIDAGATKITVEIKNGGISYIKITDNGKGIAEDDMELAFERHATSKIRSADDLNTVMSMGFRGEALASITAIARVEMVSKTASQSNGYRIVVEGGKVLEKGETGCADGTSITVTNLFYNTPVRYKFLKKDFTEAGYIEDVITRIALVHPEISIKLINAGKTIIQTNGNGDLKTVIYSIYGKDIAEGVIKTDYEYEGMHIYGVIGKPEIARSNRSNQIFFVNKRYVRDKSLSSAAEKAYKGMIPIGRFSFLILNIDMNPNKVDVNVHPAKLEVRFEEENVVFKAIYHAIRDTLLKAELVANTDHASSSARIDSGLFGNKARQDAETIVEQIFKQRQINKIPYAVDPTAPKSETTTNTANTVAEAKSETQANTAENEQPQQTTKNEPTNTTIQTPTTGIMNGEGMSELEKSQEVLRKLQEIKDKLINESPELKAKLEEKDGISYETTEPKTASVAEEGEPYKITQQETNTAAASTTNNNNTQQPELKVDLLEEIAKANHKQIDLKEEVAKALEPSPKEEPEEQQAEGSGEYSKEFEEMYLRLFGTKPVRGNNLPVEEESQEEKATDIATTENISMFDGIKEYQKPTYKFIGIVFRTYIIVEIEKEMYIIDQHAAHERILYEKIKANYYNDETKDSQLMLLPDIITLTHKEMEIAKDNMKMFRKAGFILEEFGENTIKLTGVPEMCLDLETKEMFLETLDEINTVSRTAKQEVEERFIATVACKAAVKANMALTQQEVESLMDQLLQLPNPFTCPHGRPTAIKMSKYDIERKFARK